MARCALRNPVARPQQPSGHLYLSTIRFLGKGLKMEKSFPEKPDSIIDDDSLWPDQINGAPPYKPPEKLPKMVNTEEPKSGVKAKGNRVEICESTGKRKWHRKQAAREAKRWRRDKFAPMNSYKCKSCKSWHVGNSTPRKPKQRGR